MGALVGNYLIVLATRFGQGWNRFWYTPSDPYPLGVMRIALGLLLLYLHATYTFDLVAFFGPNGLIPTELVETMRSRVTFNPTYLSYLYAFQDPTALYVVHAIGAIILVLFTIGFKSRWTCVLALLVSLAYYHRAPFLTSGVEQMSCMMLFYMCFGPCGATLSVDRWLALRRAENDPIFARKLEQQSTSIGATISIRLIQVHLSIIYLVMGVAKLSGPAVVTGTGDWVNPWHAGHAVWLLAARPESPWFDLTWMAHSPYIFQGWTMAIMVFEIAFGVFIWNRLARPLLLLFAIPMWCSLALISGTAPFCVAMLIAGLAFFSRDMLTEFSPAEGRLETAPAASG